MDRNALPRRMREKNAREECAAAEHPHQDRRARRPPEVRGTHSTESPVSAVETDLARLTSQRRSADSLAPEIPPLNHLLPAPDTPHSAARCRARPHASTRVVRNSPTATADLKPRTVFFPTKEGEPIRVTREISVRAMMRARSSRWAVRRGSVVYASGAASLGPRTGAPGARPCTCAAATARRATSAVHRRTRRVSSGHAATWLQPGPREAASVHDALRWKVTGESQWPTGADAAWRSPRLPGCRWLPIQAG